MRNKLFVVLLALGICGCTTTPDKKGDIKELAANNLIENSSFFDFRVRPQIKKQAVEDIIIAKRKGDAVCDTFGNQKVAVISSIHIYQNSSRIKSLEMNYFDKREIRESHFFAYKISFKNKPEIASKAKELFIRQLQRESDRLYLDLLQDIRLVTEPFATQSNILITFDNDKVDVESLNCPNMTNITHEILLAVDNIKK